MNGEFPVNLDKQAAHRDAVSRYFSTKTDFWEVVYTEENGACSNYMGFHMRRRRDVVLDCLRACHVPGGTVLDIGCGSGALLVAMADLGYRVHGMDISPGMVAKARKFSEAQGGDPECVQLGEIEATPYEDNFFDVVTCVGVLEYVCDEKAAFSELKRIVKPGGKIIITMPNMFKLQNILDPYYWFVRSLKYVFYKKLTKKTEINPEEGLNQISTNSNYTNKRYSCHKLVNIFNASNLVPVDWIGLGYGPFTLFRKKIFTEDFSIKISGLLEGAFKRVPMGKSRFFANRWVICLKEKGL